MSGEGGRSAAEPTLHINLYFKDELMMMLARAGFTNIDVRGTHNDRPPTRADDFLVFVAREPRGS